VSLTCFEENLNLSNQRTNYDGGVMLSPAVIVNVDDNEPNRYARNRILVHAGFTAYDAGTGQGALDLVALHRPDLVLLDVNLPDLDGIEVCRRLKTSPASASTIVLQISASAVTARQATAALNNGADAYLTEPVESNVLIATINALLRLRRAERQLAEANAALHEANIQLASVNRDLRRSNEDLQQFAFFASHDLQEPLRNVTNFVQLVEKSASERLTDEERQCMGFVVDGAQRMERLIHALLAYSQLAHGERVSYKPVDLQQVINQVMEDLRYQITENGANIAVQALPQVWGDSVQLGDVFQNLIANAIKYRCPEHPLEVQISAIRLSPAEWRIGVRDNGPGIAPAYRDQIFIPFKRLHGREIPGTGIGLAICRRIVEAHGGRIQVESAEGRGAVFTVDLPAVPID
jgi:two-component system sensor histidine kinase/response regulator